MFAKWAIVGVIVIALGIALWGSDKITYEGERTIYSVRCEQGNWEGLACKGRMVAGERYRFRASVSKQEVLYWIVGSSQALRQVQSLRGQGSRQLGVRGQHGAGQPATITRSMSNGRPKREEGYHSIPFRAVPKWVWWVLDSGLHVYSKAGY
jgi:hypothetical protein